MKNLVKDKFEYFHICIDMMYGEWRLFDAKWDDSIMYISENMNEDIKEKVDKLANIHF